MIGKTVGKYRILDRLGRGGMGIVYKALDETLDREVAIKVLNPDLGDAELLKRFRAEAVSLARLNHPGIATIYELHRHEDDLLMVMEFVRGETLQTLSERLGPLDPPQAAHICLQILDALAHAHRSGIIHRDLKPANVMVTDTGVVKVMDFGIARMLGGEHFTHAGYMMGTPAYMAPEQVLGNDIDGRADLYSVGVLFYRLLSRELPFQADTAIAMAQKQVAEAPTPIGLFRPDLPAWCESVIARALSKAPAERFQTAEAFRAAIATAVTPATLGELPTMATPTAASVLRTSDLTLPHPVGARTATPASAAALRGTGVDAPSGASAVPAAATPGTTGTSPMERTGTTVVLGRTHLIAMAALLVVLIAGIAALGFAALKRGAAPSPAAVTPALVDRGPESGAVEGQPELQQAAVTVPEQTVPASAATPPPADAPPSGPSASPPPAPSSSANSPSGTAGQTDAPPRKPRVEPPPPKAAPRAEPAAATPDVPPPPSEPVTPAIPPVTFDDVKVAVVQGDTMREREAVLTLAGDHLSVRDRSGESEFLSLRYSSVEHAFYSRSKQPKWKGPDGKEVEASVDLGKLSFFRGDRNWLILTTQADPVFIRFEDPDLRTALPAVEERIGVKIQR
jgi:serine/threonine-protein kinase